MYYVFVNVDFFDYILYINNDLIFLWMVKYFLFFCIDVRYFEGILKIVCIECIYF